MDAEDVEMDEVPSSAQPNLNNSFTQSGLSRIIKPCQSISTQTKYEVVNCKLPKVNRQVCTDNSKAVCTNLYSVVGISVQKARKSMQLVFLKGKANFPDKERCNRSYAKILRR